MKHKTILRIVMMIDKIVLGLMLISSLSFANLDSDMDGVIDSIDKCPNTPFLNEVDASGCTTNLLKLPEERDDDTLEVDISYGFSNDEDTIDRDKQHLTKLQMSYYLNDWSYSINTGYFTTASSSGFSDTALKIKKRFTLTDSLKLSLGVGVKLPSYDFVGNQTDYSLYSSISYSISKISLFAGWSYTFIEDEESIAPLKNTNTLYIGTGYFWNKDIYTNIAYTSIESKFEKNHADQSIIASIFYTINEKWFTTITYAQEIGEDNIDNKISLRLGYRVW